MISLVEIVEVVKIEFVGFFLIVSRNYDVIVDSFPKSF